MTVKLKWNKMETLDQIIIAQSSQLERPKDNYRPPAEIKGVDPKKELPGKRYFTLSKIRTYNCELKVE